MIQWMCPESCASLLLFVYLLFHPGKKIGGGGSGRKLSFKSSCDLHSFILWRRS